jgi:hypothetical protein
MVANSIYEPHRKAVADSGVRPFVFYNLRHTFLTSSASGVDAWTLMRIAGPAGHSNIKQTVVHCRSSDKAVHAAMNGFCAEWLQKWLQCQIGEKDKTDKSRKVLALDLRRGAGVAEQGCLLSSYPGKTGIGGSNPPLSAIALFSLGWTPS